MSNTFGEIFTLTTFGESHGEAIGGIIDGCPAGITIDFDAIQQELNRRKPGQSKIVTQRKEADKVQFLSGIFEGKTTGTSIGFIIHNQQQRSKDYDHIKDAYRPSHADYTYDKKFGHRDYRGGGRTSARETANWVVGGAVAKQVIAAIKINAFTSSSLVTSVFLKRTASPSSAAVSLPAWGSAVWRWRSPHRILSPMCSDRSWYSPTNHSRWEIGCR